MRQRTATAVLVVLGLGFALPAPAQNVVNVTTTDDVVDGADGVISLREAFTIANTDADDTDILLAPGALYPLTLCGPLVQEDANLDGDLDHTAAEALRLVGNGAVVQQTCAEERVVDSHLETAAVTLEAITITGGNLTDTEEPGGSGRVRGPLVVLDSVVVENAAARTGGLYVGEKFSGGEGNDLLVERSHIADNTGGALFAGDFNGSITLLDASVVRNTGTGLSLSFGPVTVRRALIAENGGSGISLVDGYPLLVEDATVRDNGGLGIGTTGQGEADMAVRRVLVANNGATGVLCSYCNEVTVENSSIVGNTASFGQGGGLRVVVGNPFGGLPHQIVLDRVLIAGNFAPDGGGGVAVIPGDDLVTFPMVTLLDSTVRENQTGPTGNGGGLAILAGDLTVARSRVAKNTAGTPGEGMGASGGGIYYTGERELSVSDTTLERNVADGDGGGLLGRTGEATLWRARVRKNHATSGDGGGLLIDGGNATVLESSVFWNEASGSGGGIASVEVTGGTNLVVERSSLYWNDAGVDGGGLFADAPGGSTALINSTVHANDAGTSGGAVRAGPGSDLTLVFSTLVQNVAPLGANVRIEGGLLAALATVIAQGAPGDDCELGGGVPSSLGYNADSDGTCGFGAGPGDLPALGDPLLEPINDYGGPTWTLRPEAGSPLVNQVPVAACLLDIDQRGVSRPRGAACDIGAVERKMRTPRLKPKPKPKPKLKKPAAPKPTRELLRASTRTS